MKTLILAICTIGLAGQAAAKATYVSFQVSGASATSPLAINAAGTVAGAYDDASTVSHGFQRTADGTITTFDPPGSQGTEVYGINKSGVIDDTCYDSNGVHGFVRAKDGTIIEFNPAGSVDIFAAGINA